MTIRCERSNDAQAIRKVHLEAFERDAEAKLIDALREAGIELISLVAETNGEIIGHILFSPVSIDGGLRILGLGPMAVLPNWQNRGVGTDLVNEGLKVCKRGGWIAVVVLGHPEYYFRFGFVPSINFGIKSEFDAPPEAFMVKQLQKGALMGLKGVVRYNQAFDGL